MSTVGDRYIQRTVFINFCFLLKSVAAAAWLLHFIVNINRILLFMHRYNYININRRSSQECITKLYYIVYILLYIL